MAETQKPFSKQMLVFFLLRKEAQEEFNIETISDFHLTGSKYSTLLIWCILFMGKLEFYRVNLTLLWLLVAFTGLVSGFSVLP